MNNERSQLNYLGIAAWLLISSLGLSVGTACSSGTIGNTGATPPPPPPTSSKTSARPAPENYDEEDSQKIEEPQQVSGAFLTCGSDVLSEDYGAADMDAPYGCAVLDQNHQKQADCSAPNNIQVAYVGSSDGTTVKTRKASNNSSWLFYFSAPFDEKLESVQADIECLGGTDQYIAKGPQIDYTMPLVSELNAGLAQLLFVTSDAPFNGNFGGRNGADKKCDNEGKSLDALGAGSANSITFVAFLSDTTQNARDLIQVDKPILNSAWQLVAKPGKLLPQLNSDPYSHRILAPILDTQAQRTQGKVWTGSQFDGTIADAQATCQDWNQGGILARGAVGDPGALNGQWIFDAPQSTPQNAIQTCNNNFKLYCLSRP